MEPLSEIVVMAMNEITCGAFSRLPKKAAIGLLSDFQYAWLHRFNVPAYKLKMISLTRMMCYKGDNAVFRATQCNSIQEIRDTFSAYIERWYKNDDRVIITVSFDGKVIKTEWAELKDYLNACEKDGATPDA